MSGRFKSWDNDMMRVTSHHPNALRNWRKWNRKPWPKQEEKPKPRSWDVVSW